MVNIGPTQHTDHTVCVKLMNLVFGGLLVKLQSSAIDNTNVVTAAK